MSLIWYLTGTVRQLVHSIQHMNVAVSPLWRLPHPICQRRWREAQCSMKHLHIYVSGQWDYVTTQWSLVLRYPSTRSLTSFIHLDFLFLSVTVSSVIVVGGNQLNGQCYLMCFVTSSSCLSRHLCWYICFGVWECQAASVVAAFCLPASLHDIWSWTHQKWFNA